MNYNNEYFSVIRGRSNATYNSTTDNSNNSPISNGLLIFILIWGLIGFIGFIMSLVCYSKSGTLDEKIIGILIALVTGPFYFLYYIFNKGYCR